MNIKNFINIFLILFFTIPVYAQRSIKPMTLEADFKQTKKTTESSKVRVELNQELKQEQLSAQPKQFAVKTAEDVVNFVQDARELIRTKEEHVFTDFAKKGSIWNNEESSIFVLDKQGNRVVGFYENYKFKNKTALIDVNGKPIVKLIIDAAVNTLKEEAWVHYDLVSSDSILPEPKSAYVALAFDKYGDEFIVGSHLKDSKMRKSFAEETVKKAVRLVKQKGKGAFKIFKDKRSSFFYKDSSIFVSDLTGNFIVNPVFPSTEGKETYKQLDYKGAHLQREFTIFSRLYNKGWMEYYWSKPTDTFLWNKGIYIEKVPIKGEIFTIGSDIYLKKAKEKNFTTTKITQKELVLLVRKAAFIFEEKGEESFDIFRKKNSEWFYKDLYIFVLDLEGNQYVCPPDPEQEGKNLDSIKDIGNKKIFKMFSDKVNRIKGQGWVHYKWPKPGSIIPERKSSFIVFTESPLGKKYIIGSGIYNMPVTNNVIRDLVDTSAAEIKTKGKKVFKHLKQNNFVENVYFSIINEKGRELANSLYPSLEGRNLLNCKDKSGNKFISKCIDELKFADSLWMDIMLDSRTSLYARKVMLGKKMYIVLSFKIS